MKTKLALTLGLIAFMTTACGKKDSYRGLNLGGSLHGTDVGGDDPAVVNEKAEATIEEQALAILDADQNMAMFRNTQLANDLQGELKGASVKIIKDVDDNGKETGKFVVQLNISQYKSNKCNDIVRTSAAFDAQEIVSQFVQVKDGGRVRCVDSTCNNAILMIEESRMVDMLQESGRTKKEYQQAVLPVLIKKDDLSVLNPVNAESENFVKLLSADVGSQNCAAMMADAASLLATDAANKAAQAEKAKKAKDAIVVPRSTTVGEEAAKDAAAIKARTRSITVGEEAANDAAAARARRVQLARERIEAIKDASAAQ